MATINDLNKEQQELLAQLYWQEEGSDEAEQIHVDLNKIYGSVEQKLKFLSGLLREAKDMTEARKEAVKRAQARAKTAANVEARLEDFIKSAMEQFGIKKVEGDVCSITWSAGRESVYLEGSDIKSITYEAGDCKNLPIDCYDSLTILRPRKDKIKEYLDAGNEYDGVELVRTPYLLVK